MNASDEKRFIDYIEALVKAKDGAPLIAFDAREVNACLRNSRIRNSANAMNTLNDVLSDTKHCLRLGDLYTICEFEGTIWLLVALSGAVSNIPGFDPVARVAHLRSSCDADFSDSDSEDREGRTPLKPLKRVTR